MAEEDPKKQPQLSPAGFCDDPLFDVNMRWGAQPVHLTAYRCTQLPQDAPTTSVHIVAFHGGRVLVVCDRKGVFGFPGGRLEGCETCDEALRRECYEEARAHLEPNYRLFAAIKIEYAERLPNRVYTRDYSYLGMYVGMVRALSPIGKDPAGVVMSRDLFTYADCKQHLLNQDMILLHEAYIHLIKTSRGCTSAHSFMER